MWSAIKAGVGTLFGASPTDAMDVVKGVGKWIDEQQFTDEEKAANKIERAKMYNGYLEKVLDENTARSLTRRSIAIWIIRAELIMLFLSIALVRIDPEVSEFVYTVATHDPMNILVLGVSAFFFGTHMLRAKK